jgi:hypothetical protein
MSRRLLPLLFVVLLPACGGTGTTTAVTIPEWSAVPQLKVGSVDDPEYSLTIFRSMVVTDDGTMYTLHPMEQIVRIFAPEGSAKGRFGGKGDGPGEFQSGFAMGQVADTLWVMDLRAYRFSQFSPEGALLGTFTVPFATIEDRFAAQPARAMGMLFDGTVHGAPPAFSSQVASGTLTHHVPMLMTRGGEVTDTLPAIAFGNNQWAVSDPSAPERGGMYMPQPWPDGPLWSYAANERALVVLDRSAPTDSATAGFTVTKLSFGGDTLFTRRYAARTMPLTGAMADSVLSAFEKRMGERNFLGQTAAGLRKWAEGTLYRPAFMPPVSHLVAGRDGTIWVGLTPDGSGEDRWVVLSPEGEAIGRIGLPSGTTVLVADREHVWGSQTDEFDVPYLVRFGVR